MEIANDINNIIEHIDNVRIQLCEQNKKNDEKIKMYHIMIETIIDEYFDLCKKIYE